MIDNSNISWLYLCYLISKWGYLPSCASNRLVWHSLDLTDQDLFYRPTACLLKWLNLLVRVMFPFPLQTLLLRNVCTRMGRLTRC